MTARITEKTSTNGDDPPEDGEGSVGSVMVEIRRVAKEKKKKEKDWRSKPREGVWKKDGDHLPLLTGSRHLANNNILPIV